MYQVTSKFVRDDVSGMTRYFYTITDGEKTPYKLMVIKSDEIIFLQHKSSAIFDRFEEVVTHVISDFLDEDGLFVSK